MGYQTVYDGIIFIEGDEASARILGDARCDLGFKIGAQLKSLNDVKKVLADQARRMGGNAVVNFTYGQKARWLAIDDVAFRGSGQIAALPEERTDAIMKIINSR
jgi:hypothetical protein